MEICQSIEIKSATELSRIDNYNHKFICDFLKQFFKPVPCDDVKRTGRLTMKNQLIDKNVALLWNRNSPALLEKHNNVTVCILHYDTQV
jgi:hypothetical protein